MKIKFRFKKKKLKILVPISNSNNYFLLYRQVYNLTNNFHSLLSNFLTSHSSDAAILKKLKNCSYLTYFLEFFTSEKTVALRNLCLMRNHQKNIVIPFKKKKLMSLPVQPEVIFSFLLV